MKKHLFLLLFAIVVSIGTIYAWDYEQVQIGDLYYNLDATEQIAEVTKNDSYSALITVNIPASVTYESITYGVTSIGEGAFVYCSSLTSVTIPNSVTSIGEGAFAYCSGLTSVTIPNSVTSIGDGAFFLCQSLTSITIPNSVTSIGHYAFDGCSGLISVTIPNSVTSIGYVAFGGVLNVIYSGSATGSPWGARCYNGYVDGWLCYSDNTKTELLGCARDATGNIDIPNSVIRIENYAFQNCSGLASVTIGNSVTNIGSYAFQNCSGLASATIGNSVTNIGSYAFQNCSGLASVTIGNSVTNIGSYAFQNCSGLASVTIPNSVTSIGEWAFSGCSGLASVTIPNSVTSIGNCAFSGCSGLASVTIPNSVTSIETSVFSGCSGLTSVTIPNSVTSIGNSAFSSCSGLTFVTISNSVTSIGKNAFSGCSGLTSVIIPNSVTSIGGYAFWGCSGLTSVTIPNSVTSIGGYAFRGCSSLTSVTIPNSVTSIADYAFSGCSSLTSVTIPNSVTSIGGWAFADCSSMTSVTIPNSVTSIGIGAFQNCSGLTSVTIGNNVTSIGERAFYLCNNITSVVWNVIDCPDFQKNMAPFYHPYDHIEDYDLRSQIASFSFGDEVKHVPAYLCNGMEKLTSVTIPSSVTSIGNNAFSACSGLTSISVGTGNIKYDSRDNCNAIIETASNTLIAGCKNTIIPNSVTSIGNQAFSNCSGLTSVIIPNSVTSIGVAAFCDCSNLKNVIIGSSVKVLEKGAFDNCSSIESFTCYSQRPPTVNNDAFWNVDYSTIVYVPADYLNYYKVHDSWGLFDVRPIGASKTETTEVKVEPTATTADVAWPAVENAATYELVIKDKNGNVVRTLIFNANGQLTQIDFGAPARDNTAQAAGFAFTVTGLEEGTSYDLTITAKDGNGTTLDEKTIAFSTSGWTGVDSLQAGELHSSKVLRNGEVLILRDGKMYNLQGVEVK